MNNDMTQGKIFPVLMRFAIPILMGELFQQLYNIVDTIIVGRTLGANGMAAVGATGTIMFLIVGCNIALANGFGVVTAQRFGAKDDSGVRQSFSNGIYQIVIISLFIGILCLVFTDRILSVMNTPEDIFVDSKAYISVIFAGVVVTSLYNLLAANLRAIGNSRVPLYALIFSSVLNVILDIFFILKLGMGVGGAAKATISSQAASALLCLGYILVKEPKLHPSGKDWKINGTIVRQQLYIGVPIALQNAITASGTMVMQSATNIFGSTAVAAVTASTKCRALFTTILNATGNVVATFVGQNYGAKDMKRVREGVATATKFAVIYSIITGILAYILLPWELRLFISDAASVESIMPWARIAMMTSSFFFIPLGFIFIFRNALQACGKSVFAMSAGIVELSSRLVLAYLAIHGKVFVFACLCDSAAWLLAGIYLGVSYVILIGLDKKRGKKCSLFSPV